MNIAILSIHRGDRPRFLANLERMIKAQTIQPTCIHFVDYPPKSNSCDITERYRNGYNYISTLKNIDVVALMEVDDYYTSDYLETMVKAWENSGRPDLFGTTYTHYYHIKLFSRLKFEHFSSGIAMATLIKPGLQFDCGLDHDPYFDKHLYKNVPFKLFTPEKTICLGIKHGDGMTGGSYHTDRLDRYTTNRGVKDHDKTFLRSVTDDESFYFYSTYFNE